MEMEPQTQIENLGSSETDIYWNRLDNTKFHLMGAVFFTGQCGLLQPMKVVTTRMQVAGSGLCQNHGMAVFRKMFGSDDIPGVFRGSGKSSIAPLPGRVLALASLEVSEDMIVKYTEDLHMDVATRERIANGVAGMNLDSCSLCILCTFGCGVLITTLSSGIREKNLKTNVETGLTRAH